MSQNQDSELFTPVLQDSGPTEPLYSTTTLFMVSFFAGLFAAVPMSFLNSRLLGRVKQDLPHYIFWILVGLGFTVWYSTLEPSHAFRNIFEQGHFKHEKSYNYSMRAMGVLAFFHFYLLHKTAFKINEMHDKGHRKPWAAAIAVILGSVLFHFILALFIRPM